MELKVVLYPNLFFLIPIILGYFIICSGFGMGLFSSK